MTEHCENCLCTVREGLFIKKFVDRFLAWPLPETVCSDPCATKSGYPHRTGTNLLTAAEAEQMLKHVLADCTDESPGDAPKDCPQLLREAYERILMLEESNQPSAQELDYARITGAVKGCLKRLIGVDMTGRETWEYSDEIEKIVKRAENAEGLARLLIETAPVGKLGTDDARLAQTLQSEKEQYKSRAERSEARVAVLREKLQTIKDTSMSRRTEGLVEDALATTDSAAEELLKERDYFKTLAGDAGIALTTARVERDAARAAYDRETVRWSKMRQERDAAAARIKDLERHLIMILGITESYLSE